MAEDPQTLLEFTNNILSDLDRGAITPQEALSACQQYAFFREELAKRGSQLSEATLIGDEELVGALKSIFSESVELLRERPSFQTQLPDVGRNEKEIRDAAYLRAEALSRVKEHTRASIPSYQNRRRDFIHDLVSRYSSTMPTISDKEIERVTDRALLSASQSATSAQTKERFIEMMAAASETASESELSADQQARLKSDIKDVLAKNDGFFSDAISARQQEREFVSEVYGHLDIKRADVIADVFINASDGKTKDGLLRGEKLAKSAELLESRGGNPRTSKGFLSHETATGITKGLQSAADGILGVVGEPVREMIYYEKVNGALRSLLKNTQSLTDRLGETFVHSAIFSQITKDLSRSLAEKPRSAQAGSVFGDVFSAVFRGPIDPAIMEAAKERTLDYYELARANANAPKGFRFLPDGILPWDAFSRALHPSGPKNRRSVLLPFLSLGAIGDFFGNLFSGTVDRTTSFLFANPWMPQQLSASRRAMAVPTPILEDLPLMIALVVTATLVVLFIFVSPLNFQQITRASKIGSLLASLINTNTQLNACANINNVHLYQMDPRWAGVSCKQDQPAQPACLADGSTETECEIGPSGCGSTSMAMILNAFGKNTNVETVWHDQHKIGGYAYYTDTTTGKPVCQTSYNFLDILTAQGLTVSPVGSLFDLQKTLASNTGCKKLVLAAGDEGWGTFWSGHIIVITAVSGDTITVLDPARTESVSTLHVVGAPSATNKDFLLGSMWVVSPKK